ncbi:hypothetical protein [Fervidibacter sacchari]
MADAAPTGVIVKGHGTWGTKKRKRRNGEAEKLRITNYAITNYALRITHYALRITLHASRFTHYALGGVHP